MLQDSKGRSVTLAKGINSHSHPDLLSQFRETKDVLPPNHPFFRLDVRAQLFNQRQGNNHA